MLLLEFLICSFVNMTLPDTGMHQLLSIFFLLILFAYIIWLISLFFDNGPYLSGFYKKGTIMESWWTTRSINPDYDTVEKAKQ